MYLLLKLTNNFIVMLKIGRSDCGNYIYLINQETDPFSQKNI